MLREVLVKTTRAAALGANDEKVWQAPSWACEQPNATLPLTHQRPGSFREVLEGRLPEDVIWYAYGPHLFVRPARFELAAF